MPIHDVGYRRWDGKMTRMWLRWPVVAGAGIRLVWKSSWLRRMLIFAWLPAAVIGMGFFVYEQELEQPERATSELDRLEMEAVVSRMIRFYPDERSADQGGVAQRVLAQWKEDPEAARMQVWSLLLLTFFRYPQGLLMVLLVGLIAPSLISLDFRSKAFLLYFSHPITSYEYVFGKALVIWTYLAAVTTLPALVLYVLAILLSPSLEIVLYTWELPCRIMLASLVLILPTTSLALFLSSLTTESRYAGFAWFAVWGLGWAAYYNLSNISGSPRWRMLSLYHVLGCVQEWVFDLHMDTSDVTFAAMLLIIITVMPFLVLVSRVVAPMRV